MELNREFKNSVFTLLFNDKARLLELYNALNGTNYSDTSDIEINTLQDALFKGRINDMSFLFRRKQVVLFEHQSTVNLNMALRMLLYIARIYEKMMDRKRIYSRKKMSIPRPVFIVLYNGKENLPPKEVLKLSDLFEKIEGVGSIALELEVTVYNINRGRNPEIEARSGTLRGYSELVSKARENGEAGLEKAEAVKQAVRYCLDNGILYDFLSENGTEVENMLLTEWNWDDALQVEREEAWEDGWEKGREKGREKGIQESTWGIARKAKIEGIPLDTIRTITGLSPDEIERL